MKKEIKILSAVIILLASLMAVAGCSESNGNDKSEDVKDSGSSVYVKISKLQPESFTDNLYVLGVAKAIHHAKISSDEGGRIKQFVKDKGSYVNEGDIILVIENDVLKSNMDAALAQYERAESTYVRQEVVYKEQVTSEITYLNSKFERDAAKANYELMKARYDRTFIKAPFSGIVDMKFYEAGESVMPGIPIVSLVSMNTIKIEAGIPENYVNMVEKGSDVKVVFRDLENREYASKVSYIGHTISPDNRTFPVEVLLDNRDANIKPELSAQLYIEKANYEDVFVIPEETVLETDLGTVVYVEKDGLAEMRKVKVISRTGDEIAVREGLQPGDNLIVVGYQNLVSGEKVTVTE